jgi:copper resistance protein B
MRRLFWLGLAPALLAGPALAQHAHHGEHAPPDASADPHAGHGAPAPDPHAGHDAQPVQPVQPGDAPPPPAPRDHAADRVFDPAAMAAARRQLRVEHGGMGYRKVMLEQFELRPASDADVFAWEGQASYGGDIHRFVLTSKGQAGSDDVHEAEIQALYSRAIDPYFNLEVGVRQDFEPRPRRTYATLGIAGLAPYWFELSAAAFVSDRGDLSARLEGAYDLRLTQRWILEPRVELDLSAQDVSELRLGSGLTSVEAGLRLRYEIRPEFAPYIGVSHEQSLGETADYVRAAGEDARATRFVAGIRVWF